MELINKLIGKNQGGINKGNVFNKAEKRFSLSIAKENLIDFISVLNKLNIVYWLHHGTLLGCVRDDDFIKYDSDIDIGCLSSQYKVLASAIKELEDIGFELIRVLENNGVVTIIRKKVSIDIDLYDGPENGIYTAVYDHTMLMETDLNLIKRDFLGFEVNILSNYEKLLSEWYGDDWRTPQKGISGDPNSKTYKGCRFPKRFEIKTTISKGH